jgi:hypothetical protein
MPRVQVSKIPGATMSDSGRSRATSVLTDVHFWVPVAVLIAGLFLLSFFH